MPVPLLLISDSVLGTTGLGRIARELAMRIHKYLPDLYRLATVGAGPQSETLPWKNYCCSIAPNMVIPELPDICEEWFAGQPGILFFIWNAAWCSWLAAPDKLPPGPMKRFLQSKHAKWGYFPLDADGPNGIIPESQIRILESFDRVATYTHWAKNVILRSTIAHRCDPFLCEVLPHGTDATIFFPQDREIARARFLQMVTAKAGRISRDVLMLGINATNTSRKNWALGFEVAAHLLDRRHKVHVIGHTDAVQSYWNLLDLAAGFGIEKKLGISTLPLDDPQMATWYNAMDVTLGIGAGEGWGLALSESLACGRPVIHGNYAGGTEFVPAELLVDPVAWSYEGYFNCRRPVFEAKAWADRVEQVVGQTCSLDPRFTWAGGAWEVWEKWLREGER